MSSASLSVSSINRMLWRVVGSIAVRGFSSGTGTIRRLSAGARSAIRQFDFRRARLADFATPCADDFVRNVEVVGEFGVALCPINRVPKQVLLHDVAVTIRADATQPDKPAIGFAAEDQPIFTELKVAFMRCAAMGTLSRAIKVGGIRPNFFGSEDLRVEAFVALGTADIAAL